MMHHTSQLLGVTLCMLSITGPRVVAESRAEPPGQWLVDRARSYAMSGTSAPTVAEAQYVLLWMRAASRLSPDLPQAYLWQFDLLNRLGHEAEALNALRAYCERQPDDEAARLDWIDLGIEARQTLDDRRAFCQAQLEQPGNPPNIVSELQRRMADLARRAGDDDAARRYAQAAVDASPYNLYARALALELTGRADDPVEQVRLLLHRLGANPARGGPLLDLVGFLDELSLHDRAAQWYAWSVEHFRRRHPGMPPPIGVMIDWAASLCDGGQYAEAFDVCNAAMSLDPANVEAQVLMIRIARLRGLKDVADKQTDMVARHLVEMESTILAERNGSAAAQSAWFHIRYKPEPGRALRMATLAAQTMRDDPISVGLLGWATLLDGRAAEAESILTPVAGTFQHAAIPLAKAQLEQGHRDKAIETLRRGEKLRYSGQAYDTIIEMLEELGLKPAPKPDHTAVTEALDQFDRAVLGFYDDPAKALKLDVKPAARKVGVRDPFLLTFTLSNVGSYPVTLGADGMVANPQVLVSVMGLWPDAPAETAYLSVSLMRKYVLLPGERIVVRQNVKLGGLAQYLEVQPQREANLEFSFVFDPVPDDQGNFVSRLPGIELPPVKITRSAVDGTPRGVAGLTAAIRSGNESQKSDAVQTLTALVVERRSALAYSIDYSAMSVDPDALLQTALTALRDPSPLVRAHAVDALALLPAEPPIVQAAAPLLSDPNFLVRMLAVDVLANGQGPVFAPVVQRLADADADPLVKELAGLFQEAWRSRDEAAQRPTGGAAKP